MIRQPLNTDDSCDSDAVWKLLEQVPPVTPGQHFVADTVRAARLTPQQRPWWQRLWSPAPLAGLAAATAALVLAAASLLGPTPESASQISMGNARPAAASLDMAETETCMAAIDHLDNFSDTELVSLIGF